MPEYPITAPNTSIGSADSCAIVLREPGVAAHHAVITRRGPGYYVMDAGSGAGTLLNKHQVLAPTRLANSDLLGVGRVELMCAGFGARRSQGWLENYLNEALLVLSGIVILLIIYFYGFQFLQRLLSYSPTRPQPPVASAWLNMVNHYRARAHLVPVAGDGALSAGDLNHVKYLLQNLSGPIRRNEELGAVLHFEQPPLAGYSAMGAAAGLQSQVLAYGRGLQFGARPPLSAIDHWMATVFARMAILNPGLQRVGYAEACVNGACAAALNVAAGRGPLKRQLVLDPIEYPPDRAMVSQYAIARETPAALSACPGYKDAGLPITIQLGPWTAPRLERYALSRAEENGAAVAQEACGFDANSYANSDPAEQWYGRALLRNYGAAVIIPRHPLRARSRYQVEATIDGRTYRWSFFTASDMPQ